MSPIVKTKRRRSRRPVVSVHKPQGVLQPRVRRVGPEHFGIVAIDCAKARSKWMLCDFFGTMLVPPTELPHSRGHFAAAIARLRAVQQEQRIEDLIVAIERTGRYHRPVERAFRAAGLETRLVHPFATKRLRESSDPGNKTDDKDLAAIFRAASIGFGLLDPPLDAVASQLRLWARHRRDLVEKQSALCCQIREQWEATLPGFAALFHDLWKTPVALVLARRFASPHAVDEAGHAGLATVLHAAAVRFQPATLERVLAWARTAASPDPEAETHFQIALALDEDRVAKAREIQALERRLAALVGQTPYVLLLVFPGINVVSAAELGGEMGPIEHYANARAITGRCGLYPSRYQSDQVDFADGSLVRCANRQLRAALLWIARNLAQCNRYFQALAAQQRAAGKDPRWSYVRIASHFCRIAYPIVAGRRLQSHPCLGPRHYVLDKLLAFHRDHETPSFEVLANLQAATAQLDPQEFPAEAVPLARQLERTSAARRRGPMPLADILPLVLAKLGASPVQSINGEPGPG
jgi:transposase